MWLYTPGGARDSPGIALLTVALQCSFDQYTLTENSTVEFAVKAILGWFFHGKANVVFCDGHVESPTLQFLFADTSDAALARWKTFRSGTMRTATNHLPHREKLSP
jgi:prepilin-type processing-associated H-X9-DG protein